MLADDVQGMRVSLHLVFVDVLINADAAETVQTVGATVDLLILMLHARHLFNSVQHLSPVFAFTCLARGPERCEVWPIREVTPGFGEIHSDDPFVG